MKHSLIITIIIIIIIIIITTTIIIIIIIITINIILNWWIRQFGLFHLKLILNFEFFGQR
jgi:hypothetical protein